MPAETIANVEASCPPALADTRVGGTAPNSYQEPSDADHQAARAALARVLAGDANVDVSSFGFEAALLPEWPGTVLFRERPDHRRGAGAYVLRMSTASKLLVQAPHTFFDEGTLPLACALFARSRARALFINTVHRYKGAPPTPDGKHPSDVAHSGSAIFQAMTEGAIDALGPLDVLQVHGFQNREAQARAVVSIGDKSGGDAFLDGAAAALEAAVGPRVLRYPADTSELGATTNTQGMVVRRSGGRFLHVEMDEGLRRELLADARMRAKALDALAGAFKSP
jgi:hypothetical protein